MRRARSNAGSAFERRVERLDDALRRGGSRPRRSRPTADALVGQLAAGEVDARDLEQRDPSRARVDVAPRRPRRGSAAASCAARSARPRSARAAATAVSSSGRGSACRSRRSRAPTSASSTRRRSCCSRVSGPNISRRAGSVNGTSSSRKRATSSITSTSRVDVAGAPGRDDDVAVLDARSRAARGSRTARSGGRLDADHRVGALGPEADHRALGQLAVDVAVRRPARAGELERAARSRGRRRARRGAGRRPSPSGSSPRCAAAAARSVRKIAVRLEVRRLEQDGRSSPSPISVSSPPMIPASATGALGVGDHQVVGRRARGRRRRACAASRPAARGGRRSGRRAASSKSNACSGLPSASIT